jgi:hypothetical protein
VELEKQLVLEAELSGLEPHECAETPTVSGFSAPGSKLQTGESSTAPAPTLVANSKSPAHAPAYVRDLVSAKYVVSLVIVDCSNQG